MTLSIKKYEKTLLAEEHVVLLHVATSASESHESMAELTKRLKGAVVIYELIADTPEKI